MTCPPRIRYISSPATHLTEVRRLISPQCVPALFANWFDQLGLPGGLQQFHLDGKKRCPAAVLPIYHIDYIDTYGSIRDGCMALVTTQKA
jgi:hypothetical protein